MTDYPKFVRLRLWADAYTEAAIAICGRYVLRVSDMDDDMHHAADLVTVTMHPLHIGLRIRDASCAIKYPFDFTLRCRVGNSKTELEKIETGHCDWLWYGFAADIAGEVARWFLIDLNELRQFWRDNPAWRNRRDFPEINNGDGTSLRAFDVRRLPRSVLIASSHPVIREVQP
jgi:hypothetical protein